MQEKQFQEGSSKPYRPISRNENFKQPNFIPSGTRKRRTKSKVIRKKEITSK